MRLSGHVIGLLKAYMQDLVEQARQDDDAHYAFGYTPPPYRPDQALSDLLAILDDRIESEGVEMGLPLDVLHQMWAFCNEAEGYVKERVWLEANLQEEPVSKAKVRELAYQALIQYLEQSP